MSNGWIEPPPPQKGMGCLAKGCLILVVFIVLLVVAAIAGTFWGVRYLKANYFPKTQATLPANTASEHDQDMARSTWYSFEHRARAHMPAHLEMTADELNALIASEPKLRGKAYVTINNNVARIKVSIPLDEVKWLRGHYLNAEATIQSPVDGNPAGVRFTNLVINGRQVAEDALNLQYQPWSLRRFFSDWTEQNNLKTLEIRDNKVILEARGTGE